MPNDPQGKDKFEYEKNRPGHKYKASCSEEELGDMHLDTENYSVALEYFERAIQKVHLASPDPSELARLHRKISDCYRKKGLLREAMTFLQSAATQCREDDEISKGAIACRRGIILYESSKIEEALKEGNNAYRILRTSDEHREVAHTQLLIANCYARLCRDEEAEQYFLDALSSYRRINDTVGESYVLNNLGLFHKNACRWGRALQFLSRALEICDEIGLTQHRVRVTLNLGLVHLKKRDFASAESAFISARTMAKRIGDDLKYTKATEILGVKEMRTGNLVAAEKHLLEARVLAERRGYQRELALADEFIGDLMTAKGDLDGALENYTLSLSEAKKISSLNDIVAEVQRRMMNVYLLQKKADQVIDIGRNAVETCRKTGELHEIGFVERILGQGYGLLEDDMRASEYINKSIKTFLSVNNPYEAHKSGVALAEHLYRSSERKSMVMAKKLVSETLSFFERTEEYSDLAASHYLLAKIEEKLGNRDECLLHMCESQRLADELSDRNLSRRLRRMRKRIENGVTGIQIGRKGEIPLPAELSRFFVHDPQIRSYLDYILSDMMRKLAAGYGFVALTGRGEGGGKPLVIARSGIQEEKIHAIVNWFMKQSDAELSEKILITDTSNDKRTRDILSELPGEGAPAYFHPLRKNGRSYGLIFFQARNQEEGAPQVGSIFEVVSTYAGFIGFLVKGLVDNPAETNREKPETSCLERIITRSDKMRRVLDLAARVSGSDSTVLLMGETGTGKGLIAQAIHEMSPRNSKKLIHVNCAALPEQLLESELFGHVKGAFTGAIADKKGLLTEADGGTVFLDEIDKSPLPIQGKLLQFLDSGRVRPVGGNEMQDVDVRLIFASKADLRTKCREGRMLEDFFYRISDFPITVPPLRDRTEDIDVLAEHYLKVFCSKMNKRIMGFSDDAMRFLLGCSWPGNVRELEKIVKRSVILCDDNCMITPAELAFDDQVVDKSSVKDPCLNERIKDLEIRIISEVLQKNGWNRRSAAAELCISYPTLLKKIKDYGLSEPI